MTRRRTTLARARTLYLVAAAAVEQFEVASGLVAVHKNPRNLLASGSRDKEAPTFLDRVKRKAKGEANQGTQHTDTSQPQTFLTAGKNQRTQNGKNLLPASNEKVALTRSPENKELDKGEIIAIATAWVDGDPKYFKKGTKTLDTLERWPNGEAHQVTYIDYEGDGWNPNKNDDKIDKDLHKIVKESNTGVIACIIVLVVVLLAILGIVECLLLRNLCGNMRGGRGQREGGVSSGGGTTSRKSRGAKSRVSGGLSASDVENSMTPRSGVGFLDPGGIISGSTTAPKSQSHVRGRESQSPGSMRPRSSARGEGEAENVPLAEGEDPADLSESQASEKSSPRGVIANVMDFFAQRFGPPPAADGTSAEPEAEDLRSGRENGDGREDVGGDGEGGVPYDVVQNRRINSPRGPEGETMTVTHTSGSSTGAKKTSSWTTGGKTTTVEKSGGSSTTKTGGSTTVTKTGPKVVVAKETIIRKA
mmetsp:Transcript_8086/g.19561  ORF Transcript_8086/g.19561 Transcript_8086/m.19561 type:complete len:476 (+) Transcript_8086:163-1590(+)|eukprot:CAMPEP_0178990140 /NCGR_PEP_ID=MMETSP0795-20121207/4764_1 /TAXON_ID=88552 /ORGANISM="Amoebophrya sp., Strain Ameob2" /LENGTH=475 /DNA_ID=CAMNT_0020681619 /DNA_START=85 /DNA_END=1512 /DNA_ORIENTATION=+